MQTPLSPLAGCGPVGEGTSGKVLNWTVRSLNHAYTTTPTNGISYFGGGGGGENDVIHDFWYLGKGGGEGDKILKCYTFDFLSYLRSVLIFIKQYNDSMCFSTIYSLKFRIIPYLCEIDIRTPTSFCSS